MGLVKVIVEQKVKGFKKSVLTKEFLRNSKKRSRYLGNKRGENEIREVFLGQLISVFVGYCKNCVFNSEIKDGSSRTEGLSDIF